MHFLYLFSVNNMNKKFIKILIHFASLNSKFLRNLNSNSGKNSFKKILRN